MTGEPRKVPLPLLYASLDSLSARSASVTRWATRRERGSRSARSSGFRPFSANPITRSHRSAHRRSVNMSVVAAFHQSVFRHLESIGVYIGEKGFKLLQVAFVVEQALDKGGIGDHVGDGQIESAGPFSKYVFSRTSGNCMETACSTCFRVIGLSAYSCPKVCSP